MKWSNMSLTNIKAYIARVRLRNGIEKIKLANRIELLKMQEDEGEAKVAIFRAVVLAKVWETRETTLLKQAQEILERVQPHEYLIPRSSIWHSLILPSLLKTYD